MKKVFAIVTILVVLVGTVFAGVGGTGTPETQNSKITIKSVVAKEDPEFVLKGGLTSAYTVTGDGTVDGTTTHDGTLLNNTTQYAWDISQADITAYFGIYQTYKAKNQFTYTFTVTPTKFVQVKDGSNNDPQTPFTVDKDVDIANVVNTNWFATSTDGVAASTAPSVTDGSGDGHIDTLGGSVRFDGNGVVNADAATTNVLLSSFEITWTYDKNAPAGEYLADILLTVVAN